MVNFDGSQACAPSETLFEVVVTNKTIQLFSDSPFQWTNVVFFLQTLAEWVLVLVHLQETTHVSVLWDTLSAPVCGGN